MTKLRALLLTAMSSSILNPVTDFPCLGFPGHAAIDQNCVAVQLSQSEEHGLTKFLNGPFENMRHDFLFHHTGMLISSVSLVSFLKTLFANLHIFRICKCLQH